MAAAGTKRYGTASAEDRAKAGLEFAFVSRRQSNLGKAEILKVHRDEAQGWRLPLDQLAATLDDRRPAVSA